MRSGVSYSYSFSPVEVLSWGGAWCGGNIVVEVCVPRFVVASYVWPNICSEWLQVVSGQVLYGGSTCICRSVGEGFFFKNETVHTLMLLAGVLRSREEENVTRLELMDC